MSRRKCIVVGDYSGLKRRANPLVIQRKDVDGLEEKAVVDVRFRTTDWGTPTEPAAYVVKRRWFPTEWDRRIGRWSVELERLQMEWKEGVFG